MDDDNRNVKLNKFYSLSENENRKIRMKYRNHMEDLSNVNTPDGLIEKIDSVNELYQKVNRTQEATLDSQFLLESAEIGAKQAESIKLAGENFDTEDWINKLLTIMGGRQDIKQEDEDNEENVNLRSLKWENIGIRVEPFFDRVPKIDNMIGPLSTEEKKRKNIVRGKRENKNSVNLKKPKEIRKEDIKEQENETTKNVVQIGEILEEKGQVNLFEFIVNPDSFSQTVENIFYLSFLIRDERTDPPDEEDYLHGIKKKQFVLEIDENTWKEIIEVYDIKEPMIPTRPKVQMNNSKWYGLQ